MTTPHWGGLPWRCLDAPHRPSRALRLPPPFSINRCPGLEDPRAPQFCPIKNNCALSFQVEKLSQQGQESIFPGR